MMVITTRNKFIMTPKKRNFKIYITPQNGSQNIFKKKGKSGHV